jgi:GNAT superfamily N-acetyltransferase
MIEIKEDRKFNRNEVIELYEANKWSSAKKPDLLMAALKNSHSLVTARENGKLIGLANAISDGHLVVYYPHLLVHPNYHKQGVGKKIVDKLKDIYSSYHQQMLVADGEAIEFYKKCGFELAGRTKSMWIYSGGDH